MNIPNEAVRTTSLLANVDRKNVDPVIVAMKMINPARGFSMEAGRTFVSTTNSFPVSESVFDKSDVNWSSAKLFSIFSQVCEPSLRKLSINIWVVVSGDGQRCLTSHHRVSWKWLGQRAKQSIDFSNDYYQQRAVTVEEDVAGRRRHVGCRDFEEWAF